MTVASQLGQELAAVFQVLSLSNYSPLYLRALRVTGRLQITARMAGPWRVAPQKRHSWVCVNRIVLVKCIVQKQRCNFIAAQTSHLESP